MKKIVTILSLLAIIMVACVSLLIWLNSPRGKLPWSARNIQVYSKSYGAQGWTYCMKAELPERDFLRFVSRLGATHYRENPVLNAGNGHDIQWEANAPSAWWNPTTDKTNTYGLSNGMGLDILKYENGNVYFKSTGS